MVSVLDKDVRETPREFFDKIDEKFRFTVDVCATAENTKCARYFSPDVDGLKQNWDGEVCWCNPPYSDIRPWIEKALQSNATTVLLLPAATDTKWFHELVLPYCEVSFIPRRITFVGKRHRAPFASMLVIVRRDNNAVPMMDAQVPKWNSNGGDPK